MNEIPNEIADEILRRLKSAENEHNVRILYCCESGSRAWGFASPDSDYDVRFIYVRPREWYLSFDVERRRDVIEYPIVDEIDCGGWDIRKALYLFTRTNGALLEWLNSPIIYVENGDTAAALRDLAPQALNKIALCYHYSHMARGNAREYLFKDQARLKKYFYVLRPLLAIRYLEQDLGVPPVKFTELLQAVAPESIKPAVHRLLELKRRTPELGLGDPVVEINQFIETELARHAAGYQGEGRPDVCDAKSTRNSLNNIFRAAIADAFS